MATNQLTVEEFGQTVKLQYPEYRGMSDQEIGEATLKKFPEYQSRIKPEEGFMADIKGIGSGIKKSFNEAVESVDESQEAQKKGEQTGIRTLAHTAGQTAGFVSDTIGEIVIGGLKALTPQPAQEAIGNAMVSVAQGVAESEPAQDMVDWYQSLDEVQQRDVDASLGVVGLALDVAGGALIKNPVKAGVTKTIDTASDVTKAGAKATSEAVDTVSDATQKTFSFIKEKTTPSGKVVEVDPIEAQKALQKATEDLTKAIEGGVRVNIDEAQQALDEVTTALKQGADQMTKATEGVGGAVKSATDVITDIPRRASTNINNARATREAIEALPTQTAQRAVRDGIDINDVRRVYTITDPNTQSSFKKLHETVKAFEADTSKTNPIELVGKPIVTRLKTLDGEAQRVGKELSAVADNLGEVTAEEVNTAVLRRLTGGVDEAGNTIRGVRGLEGLKVGDDGLLDFSNTVLASSLSKADQTAINEIFQEATKAGTGKSKHLLRQELFELLNGKKNSLQNITGTQEKAYQAVRQGLADVLDSKNADYKRLNQEYAQIITPVTEMRKMMRQIDPDIDEDILEMSAGLLARRLTSNSATNPKIRLLLRQLDEASKVDGKTALSVEQLQDFYNILERYYDIAGKTGFQGQISSGVEKGNLPNMIVEKIRSFGGRSDAVRQKALEDLIAETYGG